jgi:hypothetical protein
VRALELLLGRYPAAELTAPEVLPPMPAPVPAGLPSELLERRPDIIAAERRVAAAFNRVGEAQAARLPRISLTAGVSSISSELFVLQERDNPMWSAGATLLAPIYEGGSLKAQVEIRDAEQRQALAEYGRLALRAFDDVESALATEFAAREREAILARAVTQWERAVGLAQTAYKVGSLDLRPVQQQQLAMYAARSALLRMQSEQRIQRVNVHLALGGGFGGPGVDLRDRTVVRSEDGVLVIDVFRVVGSGSAEINAPASGWPGSAKVRLHNFAALSGVEARTATVSMDCKPSAGFIRRDSYECAAGSKRTGRARLQDDYVEIDLPASMLTRETARVDLRWSERAAVATR